MGKEGDAARQPWARLSAGERARFLEVLRVTGNRRAAAEAIGVEPRLMDQRREHDSEFDREWEAAVEEAHRRLSAAEGPFGCEPHGKLNMIRRGKRGRLQLVAAGPGRWSAEVEARFLEALRATGNVVAAARAVGFSDGTIWTRRRQWPAFALALEEMLEDAELSFEFGLAAMGNNIVSRGSNGFAPIEGAQPSPSPESPPLKGRGEERFDAEAALRFLKWREEKRRGAGAADSGGPAAFDRGGDGEDRPAGGGDQAAPAAGSWGVTMLYRIAATFAITGG